MKEFTFIFVVSCISHLVNAELPVFIKTPSNIQVEVGSSVHLYCDALGPPNLVVTWQKDGVSNFPAIQEKRWHVESNMILIHNVKIVDEGLYSCIATNKDGSVSANATVTVLETAPSCKDFQGNIIEDGNQFTPDALDLCKECLCVLGFPIMCHIESCNDPNATEYCQLTCSDNSSQSQETLVKDNTELTCMNFKSESVLSGEEFVLSSDHICQVCLCDEGLIKNCRNVTCDSSQCKMATSLCCSQCLIPVNKTEIIQNDAIVNIKDDTESDVNIKDDTESDSFDHTNNHIEVTKELGVSNKSSVAKELLHLELSPVDKTGANHSVEIELNVTSVFENLTTEDINATTEQVTELPNITCTDWKGQIHRYGEEYAPYKDDNCKLCRCEQDSKQCRTVRIIQCPDRNCSYYVWKVGMDCCEYECVNDGEFIQKSKLHRKKKLEIIKPPKNATILAEYSHTLHCRANKRKPIMYKWFKDGVRIQDRHNLDKDTGSLKYDINKKTGGLKLLHVHVEDKGEYQCKVKYGNETVLSPKVYIEVQVPVKFVGLIPFNRTIMCGTPTHLVCNVYGIPQPTMVWTKNGVEIGDRPPDGITVYNSYQANNVLSRLYISNVTETNRYGCKAFNKPAIGGLNVVKQDVQITMMCNPSIKQKQVGQCVQYNGSYCGSEMESRLIHKIINVSYEQLDRTVESMMDDITKAMNPIDDRCLSSAKRIFCNHVYPGCHQDEMEAKPVHMCRQSCLAVKELLCFDEWLIVDHSTSGYKLPVCGTLPSKLDPTAKCVDIPMFVRKPEESTNSCYKGTGQWYNGTVNVTKSGLACQAWESQYPHTHQRLPDVFPSLEGAENFCRNPGSEEKSPWCYTQDRLVRWEPCNIPKCEGEPVIPHEQKEDKPQFSTVAILIVSIVSTVGLFVIGLIVILCYQIFRQRRNIKYNSTPQDELDIDIDKLQPNISYHKMADIKLNPKLQTMEYPRNDVVYLCDIGQGAFGRVFKARAKNIVEDEGECFVAVKMLKDDASEDLQQDFEREASLMAEFDHPNIVKLLGICAIGKPMCLLFEFMENGDLNGFLRLCSSESNYIIRRNSVDKKSSEQFHHVGTNQQMYILMQISSGMVYLSDRGYVHRDLATRNCLVGDNLTVKISDFGLARSVHSMEYYKGSDHDAIPIRWMPLESILYNKFTSESDVWSFGVLIWEVFSYALQPYYGMSHEEVVQFIKDGKVLACPDKTPKAVYDLMQLCWSRKPANRPRFITISKSLHTINEEIQKKTSNVLNEIV